MVPLAPIITTLLLLAKQLSGPREIMVSPSGAPAAEL
jgi:hypothetical protein